MANPTKKLHGGSPRCSSEITSAGSATPAMAASSGVSWWIDQPRQYWTRVCSQQMNTLLLLDDVSDSEMQIIVRRQQVLSALIGLRQAKQTDGIRHANVVSN